jgi:pimeloyl-ACP methyl ester carboxylesterase
MHDILYLHGFGECHPERCRVACALRAAVPETTVHAPRYHPGGRIAATRIGEAIDDCIAVIDRARTGTVHVVGYSFG